MLSKQEISIPEVKPEMAKQHVENGHTVQFCTFPMANLGFNQIRFDTKAVSTGHIVLIGQREGPTE